MRHYPRRGTRLSPAAWPNTPTTATTVVVIAVIAVNGGAELNAGTAVAATPPLADRLGCARSRHRRGRGRPGVDQPCPGGGADRGAAAHRPHRRRARGDDCAAG